MKQKVFIVICMLVISSATFAVAIVSLPHNTLSSYLFTEKRTINLLLPEGWAFFTKDARYTRSYFIIKDGDEWIQDPRIRNATINNAYGAKRYGRVLNGFYETELVKNLRDQKWTTVPDSCFLDSVNSSLYPFVNVKVKNKNNLNLPKQMIVYRRKLSPWAYRNYKYYGEEVSFIKVNIN
uniref:Antimicrobial peptide system protein, SdpA family n=1 Tax=Sphingobacterium sp. (strain 21) TaxID=743722 RepID=F4C9S6_SPHS2